MTGVKHIEEIELVESEQKIVKFLVKYKQQQCNLKGMTHTIVGKQSDEETQLEGMGAEIAAAKILNVWPDLDHSDAEIHDFYVNRWTVDVKATKYPYGKLILPIHKSTEKACDYYVLMTGTFPKYRFAGAASKKELINKKNISSLGYNKIYMLEQHELKSIEEFLDETKARTQ